VAGAYAERLPVIFVASGYNTNDASTSHLLHHSLGTRDLSYQYEMVKYVTCAAVRIVHPGDAPSMIDHAIRAALRERKPAYIEIACNLSDAPCPEPGPCEAIMAPEESNPRTLTAAVARATALLAGANKPILLAGARLSRPARLVVLPWVMGDPAARAPRRLSFGMPQQAGAAYLA